MDTTVQTRVAELARWAPNVDNAQPFYLRWDGDRLHVLRDAGRDRRRGNAGHYASYVGLGCLVEYIRIAASEAAWQAEIELPPDPVEESEQWATVRFASGATPDELLPGLRLRASDRRRYEGGQPNDPVFAEIAADVQRMSECRLAFVDGGEPALLKYLVDAEALIWKDPYLLPEMLSWVRWSNAEADQTLDGVPWQSLGVSFVVSRFLYLLSKSSFIRRLAFRSKGPLRQRQAELRDQIASSAALGCVTVGNPTRPAMVIVGRAFVRAWLRLNLAGYGVQVMASPALHALQHATGVLPDDIPVGLQRTFAGGRQILTRAFSAPPDSYPVWMFRTGRSSALPENMRTRRRPLDDWVVA